MQAPGQPVAWMVAGGPVPYEAACTFMSERARAIANGTSSELVWLLEHPPIYTAGTSAKAEDLIVPPRFPVYRTGRGGQYTYHGPGQRIVYVMLDVKRRFGDVRAFVATLQDWTISALATLGVAGELQPGRVGVWVRRRSSADPLGSHDKIAAVGVRLSRWISSHGISLNVAPDLCHYDGIVACGIRDAGITSLAQLGKTTDFVEVDAALRVSFERLFGPTVDEPRRCAGEADNKSAPLPGGPSSRAPR